jgi:hypothetical protein
VFSLLDCKKIKLSKTLGELKKGLLADGIIDAAEVKKKLKKSCMQME